MMTIASDGGGTLGLNVVLCALTGLLAPKRVPSWMLEGSQGDQRRSCWPLRISHGHLRGPPGSGPIRGSPGLHKGSPWTLRCYLCAKICAMFGFGLYWWFYRGQIYGYSERLPTDQQQESGRVLQFNFALIVTLNLLALCEFQQDHLSSSSPPGG